MAKVRPAVVVSLVLLVSGSVGATGQEAVPLFDGLGGLSRKVTTGSPEAQRYFDQGLAFMYAFNHDEAIRAFRRAGELDPKCAMAFWGVAIANGPHINNPVVPEDRAKAAWKALGQAKALAPGASPVEQSLIQALAARYADPPARGQEAPRAGLRRRHAADLGRLPEGRRHRRALRGVAGRPAALGPLDARRQAPARHRRSSSRRSSPCSPSTRSTPSATT